MSSVSVTPTRAARTSDGVETAWRWLRSAAVFYLVAWAVHTGDHIRRGLDVVSTEVSVLGIIAAVLQVVSIAAVLLNRRWAPVAALLVGIPDAAGIAAVHLLPHWSAFSDAFPGARGTGVTGFSWFAAILEVLGALAFGVAGFLTWRRTGLARPARGRAA